MLAWLDGDEPAAERVDQILEVERPAISWINLIEIHYRTSRDHGVQEADRVLEELRALVTENLPGISAMRAAAALKAEFPMALADCFAVALATAEGADLLTGDPEIINRAEVLPCPVEDLRRSHA